MGLGSGGGVGDDRFAVMYDDVLAGEGLKLGDEIAGAAVFVDLGFVVAGPGWVGGPTGLRRVPELGLQKGRCLALDFLIAATGSR